MLKENIVDSIIRNRRSVRKFDNRAISKKTVENIISSAIWAPCPHGFQTWKFVVITKKSKLKNSLLNILEKNMNKVMFGFRIILRDNIHIMRRADTIIAVFNTRILQKKGERFGGEYKAVFNIFEIQSIAASIQNILLKSFSKNIGSLWIGLPMLFKRQIAGVLGEETNDFMAFIVLGRMDSVVKKTSRIPMREKVRYV